jgi:Acetoacetate decarboxylase (ADC)
VLLRDRRLSLQIPFIAVDSEASIAGGRGNWALPKGLAEFDWQEHDGGLPRHITARGDGWSAEARLLWSGPRVPLWMRTRQTQVHADGSVIAVPLRSRGVGRVARIEVRSEGPPPQLAAGRSAFWDRDRARGASDTAGCGVGARKPRTRHAGPEFNRSCCASACA